jgi:hypothetical protein
LRNEIDGKRKGGIKERRSLFFHVLCSSTRKISAAVVEKRISAAARIVRRERVEEVRLRIVNFSGLSLK